MRRILGYENGPSTTGVRHQHDDPRSSWSSVQDAPSQQIRQMLRSGFTMMTD
jgi:hypothetical protein